MRKFLFSDRRLLAGLFFFMALLFLAPVSVSALPADAPTPVLLPQAGPAYNGRLLVSPDGKRLLTLGIGASVVWDLASGRIEDRLVSLGLIVDAAFSPDGRYLLCARENAPPAVWDLQLQMPARVWKESMAYARVAPDGKAVLTADSIGGYSSRRTLVLRDAAGEQALCTLPDVPGIPQASSFDGKKLVMLSGDFKRDENGDRFEKPDMTVWDLTTGEIVSRLKGIDLDPTTGFWAIAASPDGSLVAVSPPTANARQEIGIWNTRTGERVQTLSGVAAEIRSLTFSPDGARLASVTTAATVVIWDLRIGKPAGTLKLEGRYIAQAAFTPDGATLMAITESPSRSGSAITCWDTATGVLRRNIEAPLKAPGMYRFGGMTADGRKILLCSNDGSALWDLARGQLVREVCALRTAPSAMVLNRDGSQLTAYAAVGDDERQNYLITLDTATGNMKKIDPAAMHGMQYLAISPDGTRAATGQWAEWKVNLWNTADWTVIAEYKAPRRPNWLAFNPDGRSLCFGSFFWSGPPGEAQATRKGFVTRVDLANGQTREIGTDGVGHFDGLYSPDSRWLAITKREYNLNNPGENHEEFTLRNPATLEIKTTLEPPADVDRTKHWGYILGFTSDSATVYGWRDDRRPYTLLAWDAATGQLKQTVAISEFLAAPHLTADGRMAVTDDRDGRLQLWDTQGVLNGQPPILRATLEWFAGGKWLITTPQGYFDCSPDLPPFLTWKLDGETFPYEKFEEEYYKPYRVQQALDR